MRDALLGWSETVLRECVVTEDYSWPHRRSRVLRLRDGLGREWIVKQHDDPHRYRAELAAYQRWVPALGDRAPRLLAHADKLSAFLLSAIPGDLAPWPAQAVPQLGSAGHAAELAVHRDAGVALRLLHRAQEPLACPDLGIVKTAELDQIGPQAAALLTRRELSFARSEVAGLSAAGSTDLVPCHHDYTPRNWLASEGMVRVIDYEWAGLDAPPADLARLHLAIWPERPDLHAAFLDGYGHLGDAETAILRGCAALTVVWLVVKARETCQPSFEHASRSALSRLMIG